MRRLGFVLAVMLCVLGLSSHIWAAAIYGNNATGGTPYIYVMDPSTMAVTDTLTNLSGTNGRGVVVVNGILYYTTANSNSVFSYTLATHTNNGPLFSVTGANALSTMAFDGTDFWIGDYSGTNHAYLYSPTGTLLKTISLSDCTSFCDGLEFFLQNGQGRLISNRVDGCCNGSPVDYDVYDTNGNLIKADLITANFPATGIAFDGTNFLVSDFNGAKIATYDGTTGAFIKSQSITGFPAGKAPAIEDLSVDYALVLGNVPEPGTFGLIGLGSIVLASKLKLRKRA